jgi:LmbE family N-acetylglucosaminyl deacetylase
MNVLAVIAHPDDEILGCGATLRRLADEGHHVFTCVLAATADARHNRPELSRLEACHAEAERLLGVRDSLKYGFKNIQLNVVPHLELVKAVEAAILRFRPEWIFTHHPGDLNVDHRVCADVALVAAMLPQRQSHDLPPTLVRRIYLFEILSSTDWAPPIGEGFRPNAFFDVKATLGVKIKALEAFEGAMKPFPHSRSLENVRHLAHLRGGQAGLEAAEAFALVREVNA